MILYLINEKSLIGVVPPACPENKNQILLPEPEGFKQAELSLYEISEDNSKVILKSGSSLANATAELLAGIRGNLVNKYAGNSVNPIAIGNLEGATDILAYFLNKVINKEVIYAGEVDKWNSFYSKVSPYFKTKLEDIPNEEDSLAAAKQKARQVETDMKNDPDWNIS